MQASFLIFCWSTTEPTLFDDDYKIITVNFLLQLPKLLNTSPAYHTHLGQYKVVI